MGVREYSDSGTSKVESVVEEFFGQGLVRLTSSGRLGVSGKMSKVNLS